MSYAQLKAKFSEKRAKICVIGLGYVGLPLAVEFAKGGFYVTGIDTDTGRVRNVRESIPYILDVSIKEISAVVKSGRLYPTNSFEALKTADAVIICVPTPLKRRNQPNISYIVRAVKEIAKYLHKDELIVLESTTYPGTTDEVILPLLEKSGFKCGRDFYLAFSPERIDPGNEKYPFKKIPKVVGGITKEATDLVKTLYEKVIVRVVPVSSARVAETVKLLENTFRLINIGLVNELSMMAHKMGIDIWEVITAAATKPFGFMPFYPGPGVGGHCLDKNEFLFLKNLEGVSISKIGDFIDTVKNNPASRRHNINGCSYIKPPTFSVLSFDPEKRTYCFKPVEMLSERIYNGKAVTISTEDGRRLSVTDKHPLFIDDNGSLKVKFAADITSCDRLVLGAGLLDKGKENLIIDVLDFIKGADVALEIRVRPKIFNWKIYKDKLLKNTSAKENKYFYDYFRYNQLPLKIFLELEKELKIKHEDLWLCTGRGPSFRQFPAVLKVDKDFCRLIGYYLSEGCLTKDESLRIRFSFNREEKEYINDVKHILEAWGLKYSIYESLHWKSSCIKVSSYLFGLVIRDVLKCGLNSYTMKIPAQLFLLDKDCKFNLLSGIFRGDASIDVYFGKKEYRKNGKRFRHNVNTASVAYFTVSEPLFQQVIILLQGLGIVPTISKRRKFLLRICGFEQMKKISPMFSGKKKALIDEYVEKAVKKCNSKTFLNRNGFYSVKVANVVSNRMEKAYSLEVADTNTFITSYGIVSHNCIPKDPLYLYWKAKHHGFTSKFIKLASQINSRMPEYIVARAKEILAKRNISFAKSRILVLGATYKKDVKDLRKSPAIEIIDLLLREVRGVSYSDPLIPYLKFNSIDLKSKPINQATLADSDCVVLATDHSEFNYDLIRKYAKVILDTRNVYRGLKDNKIFTL